MRFRTAILVVTGLALAGPLYAQTTGRIIGVVRDESRAEMLRYIEAAKVDGADSIILGCTEICLLLDPDRLILPGFDSTRIHCQAASTFAMDFAGERKYA